MSCDDQIPHRGKMRGFPRLEFIIASNLLACMAGDLLGRNMLLINVGYMSRLLVEDMEVVEYRPERFSE